MQQSGKLNRVALHLPDGPEQRQRDEMFRLAMKGSSESPDRWVDEKTRKILWEHDAEEAALTSWQGTSSSRSLKEITVLNVDQTTRINNHVLQIFRRLRVPLIRS